MLDVIKIPTHSKFPDVSVLPQVYDEAMSYYETISYLMSKINDCIKMVEGFETVGNAYTDEKVNALRDYVTLLNSNMFLYVDAEIDERGLNIERLVAGVDSDLQSKYAELVLSIEEIQSSFNVKVAELVGIVFRTKRELSVFVENSLLEMKLYIDSSYKDNIRIYNPTKGYNTTLDKVVIDLWDNLRYFSISASDYDRRFITASEYDVLNLSALEYDLYGDRIISENSELYMSNPITGENSYFKDVINMLADFHKDNPISANEYDAKQITASSYDVYNISAHSYDFTGKTILV